MLRGHGFLAHGNDLLSMASLHFYQYTFITETWCGTYAGRTWTVTHPRMRRSVLNNLFVYLNRYPESAYPEEHDIQMDGNLHWHPAPDAKLPDGFLKKVHESKGSKANAAKYPGGWEANSFGADPRFTTFDRAPAAKNDYRLQPNNLALGKGVLLPNDLVDPQRPANEARPDIGAIPLGGEVSRFGRQGRVKSPVAGNSP
jgi:hypothetical protein